MALQPYAAGADRQAIALHQANALSPEEREKRAKDAEELDVKLRYIVEDVPDRLYHTMGSNAGAGSGEFHTYRHSRRREQERLARIDEDHERTTKDKELQEKLEKLREEDDARTLKRRAKRQKKKEKQRTKRPKLDGAGPGAEAGGQQGGGSGDNSSDEEGEGRQLPVPQPDLD